MLYFDLEAPIEKIFNILY